MKSSLRSWRRIYYSFFLKICLKDIQELAIRLQIVEKKMNIIMTDVNEQSASIDYLLDKYDSAVSSDFLTRIFIFEVVFLVSHVPLIMSITSILLSVDGYLISHGFKMGFGPTNIGVVIVNIVSLFLINNPYDTF